jgi:hypothetical protein
MKQNIFLPFLLGACVSVGAQQQANLRGAVVEEEDKKSINGIIHRCVCVCVCVCVCLRLHAVASV